MKAYLGLEFIIEKNIGSLDITVNDFRMTCKKIEYKYYDSHLMMYHQVN